MGRVHRGEASARPKRHILDGPRLVAEPPEATQPPSGDLGEGPAPTPRER